MILKWKLIFMNFFQNFTADFGCISNDSVFSGEKQQLVNEVICQHFFREGLLDIAEEHIRVSADFCICKPRMTVILIDLLCLIFFMIYMIFFLCICWINLSILHSHGCIYKCVWICMYVSVCVCMYNYVDIYMYMHKCSFMCTHTLSLRVWLTLMWQVIAPCLYLSWKNCWDILAATHPLNACI